jgi:symplekin
MAADSSAPSEITLSVAQQLQQLNAARKVALENNSYYDRIVKGILPIIGRNAALELRRWGAEFLAESLATPVLRMSEKENMTVAVLETLRGLIEAGDEDMIVLKASVAAAASAYPVALRWM